MTAEVLENPLNDRRRLDAGDDAQSTAALPAGLDIDREHPLEALRPRHPRMPIDGRWLATLGNSACPGHDPGPLGARRREHAMVPSQVGAGCWYQRSESRNKVLRLENHVRGAIAIRRLECIAHVATPGRRQAPGGTSAFHAKPAIDD